jgi:hypothetical protein
LKKRSKTEICPTSEEMIIDTIDEVQN